MVIIYYELFKFTFTACCSHPAAFLWEKNSPYLAIHHFTRTLLLLRAQTSVTNCGWRRQSACEMATLKLMSLIGNGAWKCAVSRFSLKLWFCMHCWNKICQQHGHSGTPLLAAAENMWFCFLCNFRHGAISNLSSTNCQFKVIANYCEFRVKNTN